MLCIYNLPPWFYMKRSYIQIPLPIQGPRQTGNDIDVFLELVIDKLVEMFEKGVKDVWDEYKKEHVTIDQGSTYHYNHRPVRARLLVQREDKRLY
jgi:hypothetical protein